MYGLQHLDLAAQCRVRVLLDSKAIAGAFSDFVGEDVGTRAELGIPGEDVAELQGLSILRPRCDCGNATAQILRLSLPKCE